jgi:hypothetical protein
MAIDAYSVQVISTLLEGSTTRLTSPGSASTGSVLEAFGGVPMRVPAGASDTNVKLGLLSDPIFLAVYGDTGISFKIASGGTSLKADPFAFLADEEDGLGISEIWVSNSDSEEHTIYIVAAE